MDQLPDRMPPLARESMDDTQRAAADELIAGPRKGVKGPFIALLRSPRLLAPLQKAGEFATLVVSRQWTQQFEWFTHVPLAIDEGTSAETIEALRIGRRPPAMSIDEALVYDFIVELTTHRGVADETFAACIERFGERGLIDLVGLVGYFTMISMVLNVARTPPAEVPGVAALPESPL